ncbi:MAG: response regulator [Ignavibacteriaceae bacterium]
MKIIDKAANSDSLIDLKVMIVEDEFIIALDLKDIVKNLGYNVVAVATSGDDAIIKARKNSPELVLMDIMLKSKIDGVEAAEKIRKELDIPIVFISSFSDEESIVRASKVSDYGYLIKPFGKERIKEVIEAALKKHEEKNYSNINKLSYVAPIINYAKR